MASPKISALSAHLQPAVVQHEYHHRSSVLSLARLLTWSSSAPWWSSHQCNKNPLGSWRRNGTTEDTSLAQDELLGDDFSPYPIKNSLMGTACKGWGGLGSAHTVGPCVSPAQGQHHGWFLCSAGTSLSPSAQNEETPARDTGSLVLLVLQNGGGAPLDGLQTGRGDRRAAGTLTLDFPPKP